jgi:catechol 2,3-dioxygenase-like lactoylglutathione lyase family enzyme
MTSEIQVTFDCADPNRLAQFWAEALGYKLQDPPEGFDSWEDWAREQGIPEDQWNSLSAVVDPGGKGPRLLFQRVPEGKSTKNRLHLDINVGLPRDDASRRRVEDSAERLADLGATKLREAEERGEFWIVMQDPEGNEFCLQ